MSTIRTPSLANNTTARASLDRASPTHIALTYHSPSPGGLIRPYSSVVPLTPPQNRVSASPGVPSVQSPSYVTRHYSPPRDGLASVSSYYRTPPGSVRYRESSPIREGYTAPAPTPVRPPHQSLATPPAVSGSYTPGPSVQPATPWSARPRESPHQDPTQPIVVVNNGDAVALRHQLDAAVKSHSALLSEYSSLRAVRNDMEAEMKEMAKECNHLNDRLMKREEEERAMLKSRDATEASLRQQVELLNTEREALLERLHLTTKLSIERRVNSSAVSSTQPSAAINSGNSSPSQRQSSPLRSPTSTTNHTQPPMADDGLGFLVGDAELRAQLSVLQGKHDEATRDNIKFAEELERVKAELAATNANHAKEMQAVLRDALATTESAVAKVSAELVRSHEAGSRVFEAERERLKSMAVESQQETAAVRADGQAALKREVEQSLDLKHRVDGLSKQRDDLLSEAKFQAEIVADLQQEKAALMAEVSTLRAVVASLGHGAAAKGRAAAALSSSMLLPDGPSRISTANVSHSLSPSASLNAASTADLDTIDPSTGFGAGPTSLRTPSRSTMAAADAETAIEVREAQRLLLEANNVIEQRDEEIAALKAKVTELTQAEEEVAVTRVVGQRRHAPVQTSAVTIVDNPMAEEKKLIGLKLEVEELQGEVKRLQAENNTLRSAGSSNETDLDSAKATITSRDNEIISLKKRIAELETEVELLHQQASDAAEEQDKRAEKRLSSQAAEFTARIDHLHREIDDAAKREADLKERCDSAEIACSDMELSLAEALEALKQHAPPNVPLLTSPRAMPKPKRAGLASPPPLAQAAPAEATKADSAPLPLPGTPPQPPADEYEESGEDSKAATLAASPSDWTLSGDEGAALLQDVSSDSKAMGLVAALQRRRRQTTKQ